MKILLIRIISLVFLFFFTFATISKAQTIYKRDPGYYTPVLKSFYLRGGSIESTQLIGPSLGYRLDETYDISLHTELLFSEVTGNQQEPVKTSLVNIGVTFGHTARFTEALMIRSEISLYKLFNFSIKNYPSIPDPVLSSVMGSSSIYTKLDISDTILLLPNIGGFLGYGEYVSLHLPRQHSHRHLTALLAVRKSAWMRFSDSLRIST